MLKAFKFFDINDSGDLSPEEFAKAIEKIGIMIPTRQDLDTLFNIYDDDRSGVITYREFSSNLFGYAVGGSTPGKAGVASGDVLVDRLRKKLASRGARGIIGLARQFKIMDDNHSMSLDKYEFSKGMGDFGLGFSEGEIQTVFNYFDANKNGLLEYDEFLRAIRGPMNPARRAIVAKAFAIMDKDGNGYLDYNDIKGVYSASKHPDVISGKKTEQQILQEFLETFEAAHNMRSNEAPDHIVTKDEFDEYYNNVSASIDRDDYFAVMMNSAWNLDGSRVKKSGWSNTGGASAPASRGGQRQQTGAPAKATAKPENMNYSDKQLCEVMRKKLAARGARGI